MWPFPQTPIPKPPTPVVDESHTRTWFYHLRMPQEAKSLCGKPTLGKELPTRLWGYVGHLNERYCAICPEVAKERDLWPLT